MTRTLRLLLRDCRGSPAVEMALVLPLLLMLMFGSMELGNYFMNEHTLSKAVRDGARFAARQSFDKYPDCDTVDSTAVTDIKNVVMTGYLATGGDDLTPNIEEDDIDVVTSCAATADGEDMLGIYRDRADGAQIVTVSAQVSYRPIMASFGFDNVGIRLNASSQAAVTGE